MRNRGRSKKSAFIFVLKGLIPYSQENIALAYKPNRFFNELEITSGYSKSTLRQAYWRAKNEGYILEKDGLARLSAKGTQEIRPFIAERLASGARLMVIFDIPEDESSVRHQFRNFLKQLGFEQIQKSVWSTSLDHREVLKDVISELGISRYVEVYESLRIFP